MRGWAGLIGVFLPLLVLIAGSLGLLRGRRLWAFSLAVHGASWACFVFLTSGFYSLAGGGVAIVSPVILGGSPWSGDTALSWMYHDAVLSLAAATVVLCFHFLARDRLEASRATLGGIAGYLGCLLGALGAGNLFLYALFVAGALVPRLVFAGVDSRRDGIEAVKEAAFLWIGALFCLFVCVLVFSDPFRPGLGDWFRLSNHTHVVLPSSIGFVLILLAAGILSGMAPFHGSARKSFEFEAIEKAVPLALQALFGFVLLFRFSADLFPAELKRFGPYLLGFFSFGAAYCAANLVGARSARERIFWLQQVSLALAAVGFFSLRSMGWHGGAVVLFFQSLSIPLLLIVLACHERRAGALVVGDIGAYPYFALSTVAAVLFALFLPVSVGFYGLLLVLWSLVQAQPWYLPLVIAAVPVVALAGIRMMFFRLGEESSPAGETTMRDLSWPEFSAILPIAALLFFLGLVPKVLMGPIGVSAAGLLRAIGIEH